MDGYSTFVGSEQAIIFKILQAIVIIKTSEKMC